MYIWDEAKRAKAIEKHGIDFAEISDVFDDAFSIDFIDEKHSTKTETRYGVIAKTARYGLIVLFYTADDERTRFITARRAENWMVKEYEKRRNRI